MSMPIRANREQTGFNLAAARPAARIVSWALAFAAAFAVACSGTETVTPGASAPGQPVVLPTPTGVVAKVGAGFVTAEEFSSAAAATPGASTAMPLEARKEVLEELMTEEVLVMEAVKVGLIRDAKVRKVLVNLLLRQEVLAKVSNTDFTDDELRAYYDAHASEFVLPEKLQVKRILVTFDDAGGRTRSEAEAIINQARKRVAANPESFREVAEEVSEDSYKRRGGDLGFLARDGKAGIDVKVAEVAFGLKLGELSEPFEADGGLNIVMATSKREAVERTFEQMRGSVLRKIRTERYQELTEKYVEGLRAQAASEIDDAALMAVEIKERPSLNIPGIDDGHGHEHGEEGEGDDGAPPIRIQRPGKAPPAQQP
jgi:hypothetical protein